METVSLHITKGILEDLYIKQGLTTRECAEHLGMATHGPMSWYLKKFGIKTRAGKFQKGNQINKGRQCFGRKLSKETLKKMSESAKNRPHVSDKTRRKQSETRKGRKQTPAWIEKRMKAHIGHTRNCGHKNPNWKGGIAHEPYCPIWLDKEYKEDIKARDN